MTTRCSYLYSKPNNPKSKSGFSLIELVVVVTILSILSLTAYISYSDTVIDARDARRTSDVDRLQIDLKSHKQKEGSYPLPINPINLINSGARAYQGTFTSAILSNVIQNVPKDPKTDNWYWFSTTANRQYFQIGLTIENNEYPKALVKGDYRSIANTWFPTLLLTVTGSVDVITNTSKFILNGGSYNLPYDMEWSLISNTDLSLDVLKTESGASVEIGGSYISCLEVYEAGRSMGSWSYQLVNSGTALIENIHCPMNY